MKLTGNDLKLARGSLEVAIAKAGGVTALADGLGITHSAVSQWNVCPIERALEVEKLSGVSRHDLRPDIYSREES